MSDFALSWELSRSRFVAEIQGLRSDQLNWKLHSGALSIGQAALHVAGVEVSFSSQLLRIDLNESDARLKAAATDGVVNDKAFPFADDEITPELVTSSLERGREAVEEMIRDASADVRGRELVSALGPVITGEGAFARLGFHAAYHQGQVYQVKTAPRFPTT